MYHITPTVTETHKDKKTWAKIEYEVPIAVRYNEMMTELNAKDAGEVIKKLREDLLGFDAKITSPDLYDEIAMLRELNLLNVWHTFPMKRQALIIAQYRLEKMTATYRRYLELLDESAKKSKEKAAPTPKKGRQRV